MDSVKAFEQKQKLIKLRAAQKKANGKQGAIKWLWRRANQRREGLVHNITPSESRLREALFLEGIKHSFQKPFVIWPNTIFIVDFFFEHNGIKLAVELDGKYHYTKEGMINDSKRTAKLRKLGVKMLRFPNCDVSKDVDYVVALIKKKLDIIHW